MRIRCHALLSTLIAATALAACSGEPNESEVRAAYQSQLDQLPMDMGKSMKVSSFELLGCKGSDKAYECDVTVESETPIGKQKQSAQLRVVRAKDGWVITGAGGGGGRR